VSYTGIPGITFNDATGMFEAEDAEKTNVTLGDSRGNYSGLSAPVYEPSQSAFDVNAYIADLQGRITAGNEAAEAQRIGIETAQAQPSTTATSNDDPYRTGKAYEEEIKALKLPKLDKTKTVTTGTENKKSSWEGESFEDFLKLAKKTNIDYDDDIGEDVEYSKHPYQAGIYNDLLNAGLSEDDMKYYSQAAGVKNVGGVDTERDIKDIIKAFENKTPGGPLETETVMVGFENAQDAFGNKFNMSDYNAALASKKQDEDYVNAYLLDYIGMGGKVGSRVKDKIGYQLPSEQLAIQTPATIVYPGFESLLQQPFVGPLRP